jgi:hypothetical protein
MREANLEVTPAPPFADAEFSSMTPSLLFLLLN